MRPIAWLSVFATIALAAGTFSAAWLLRLAAAGILSGICPPPGHAASCKACRPTPGRTATNSSAAS
jgi:hypothetical protein